MTNFPTLYAVAKTGKVKQWDVTVEDDVITVTHGYMDGKKQSKKTTCKGKNQGKANETTPHQQALAEAQSKWNKQYDKCYRESAEEAANVGNLLPMLASDYTKVGHRINYPCDVSVKLDGVRALVDVNTKGVDFKSRGGKDYPSHKHLAMQLKQLADKVGIPQFDGELYIHGMALQQIVSCVKKANGNTMNLCYYIFDLPIKDLAWTERRSILVDIAEHVSAFKDEYPHIVVVPNYKADSEEEARKYMDEFINKGYEGMMLRNYEGQYEFNHRSGDLQKWKDFQDCEGFVETVMSDKLGEGVLHVRLDNGVRFKCKMRGTHESRLYPEQQKVVGKWITVKYQALTEDGVPQFPVGIAVRACSSTGKPLE